MTEVTQVQTIKTTMSFRVMTTPQGLKSTKAGPMYILKTILSVYDPNDALPIDQDTGYKPTIWIDVIAKGELASQLDDMPIDKGTWLTAVGDLKFGVNDYGDKPSIKATLWATSVTPVEEAEPEKPVARRKGAAKPKVETKKGLFDDDDD